MWGRLSCMATRRVGQVVLMAVRGNSLLRPGLARKAGATAAFPSIAGAEATMLTRCAPVLGPVTATTATPGGTRRSTGCGRSALLLPASLLESSLLPPLLPRLGMLLPTSPTGFGLAATASSGTRARSARGPLQTDHRRWGQRGMHVKAVYQARTSQSTAGPPWRCAAHRAGQHTRG